MNARQQQLIAEIERLVRTDPARRGLLAREGEFAPLLPGHLAEAAAHIAEHGRSAAIVTGFYVPTATPPAAETDGPPGAAMLACVLDGLGIGCTLVTDDPCSSAVAAAMRFAGLDASRLIVAPHRLDDGLAELCRRCQSGGELTHLIAVERVGPSHTLESLAGQSRDRPAPVDRFAECVPADARDRCHNVRGIAIDEHTADLHRLFDEFPSLLPRTKSIGIGDGGNEIGMGRVPWEQIVERLPHESASRLACRTATDWTILAGVSNWGAFALAAAVCVLRERIDLLDPWTQERHERLLQAMVVAGPAVDGITRQAAATVDGLPFITYIQPWMGIRRLLGLR